MVKFGDVKPGQTPLVDLDNPPDWTRPEWFLNCPNTPHIDEPLHHARLMMASGFVHELVETEPLWTIVDVGAGDGGLLATFDDLVTEDWHVTCWGYDLSLPSVEAARRRGVDVTHHDVVNSETIFGEVTIATEFLEHLVNPHAFVRKVAAAPEVRYLVASSPYTETVEHHYPLHCWAFDCEGYEALLNDNGFKVVRGGLVDMFQVLVACRA